MNNEQLQFNVHDKVKQLEDWRIKSREQAKQDPTVTHDDSVYDRWVKAEYDRATVGHTYKLDVAAPGIGHFTYQVTRVEPNGDVYAVLMGGNVRDLEPWEVE